MKKFFIMVACISIQANSYGMSSKITPVVSMGMAKIMQQRGLLGAGLSTIPAIRPITYFDQPKCNSLLSNVAHLPTGKKAQSIVFFNSCSNAKAKRLQSNDFKKDNNFRILGLAGAAVGTYILTENDKKVLAEESFSLDELNKHYQVTYEKGTVYVDVLFPPRWHNYVFLLKDGKKIGTVYYDPATCLIHTFWVDQKFRHRGFGATLLNEAIKSLEAIKECSGKIHLNARPFDTWNAETDSALNRIKDYYRRFGFQEAEPNSSKMKYAPNLHSPVAP